MTESIPLHSRQVRMIATTKSTVSLKYLVFIYVYMSLFIHMCAGACEAPKRVSDPLELESDPLWAIWHACEEPDTGLSGRAPSALNC